MIYGTTEANDLISEAANNKKKIITTHITYLNKFYKFIFWYILREEKEMLQ